MSPTQALEGLWRPLFTAYATPTPLPSARQPPRGADDHFGSRVHIQQQNHRMY